MPVQVFQQRDRSVSLGIMITAVEFRLTAFRHAPCSRSGGANKSTKVRLAGVCAPRYSDHCSRCPLLAERILSVRTRLVLLWWLFGVALGAVLSYAAYRALGI